MTIGTSLKPSGIDMSAVRGSTTHNFQYRFEAVRARFTQVWLLIVLCVKVVSRDALSIRIILAGPAAVLLAVGAVNLFPLLDLRTALAVLLFGILVCALTLGVRLSRAFTGAGTWRVLATISSGHSAIIAAVMFAGLAYGTAQSVVSALVLLSPVSDPNVEYGPGAMLCIFASIFAVFFSAGFLLVGVFRTWLKWLAGFLSVAIMFAALTWIVMAVQP